MKDQLRKMLDAVVANDTTAAQAAFHNYVVGKSKSVFESNACCDPVGGEGTKDPKDAKGRKEVNTTMADEIKASGESADDPKKAKGSADVKGTLKKAAASEIKASGESADDPKKAKGSADVKSTLKKASSVDITAAKA